MLGSLFLSCDNDDYPYAEIPSVVLNAFWARFPSATNVEFMKSGENFEVDFEWEGNEAGAVIARAGIVSKEKREISFEELPQAVQQALVKYEKNRINSPEIILTKIDSYYQIQLKQFWFDKKLVLDKTGKEAGDLNYWD